MRWLAALSAGLVTASVAAAADADVAMERLFQADCQGVLEPLNKELQAAEPRAFFVLGAMYVTGACVAEDVPRGVPLLERAAKSGEAFAAEQLVLVYGLGRGVAQDYARAGVWAVALADITASHAAAQADAPEDTPRIAVLDLPPGPLEPAWAKSFGQAATIQALATQRVRALPFVADQPVNIQVRVTVQSAGPGTLPTFTFEEESTGMPPQVTGTGYARPRQGAREVLRDIRDVFETVVREVPVLDSAVAVATRRSFAVVLN